MCNTLTVIRQDGQTRISVNREDQLQMRREETIAFVNRQIELEERIIQITESNVSRLGNVFVKELLLGIAQDSRKHISLLNALRRAVEGPTPFISTAERDAIAKGIEKHIELEAKAIESYGYLMDTSDNEQVKSIAAMIREDEVRHHRLMVELHKAMIEPETLDEDTIWDMIWKDTPWHGSPGG